MTGHRLLLVNQVEELLMRQAGIARRRQLRAAGLSRRGLARAVATGRLRFVRPDLYVTPEPRDDELLHQAVVRLDAAVSHESAALLWGIELAFRPAQPRVTVPRDRGGAAHPGVRVHRRDLGPHAVEVRGGVRVTSVLQTLLDLCRVLPRAEAVAAVDAALRQGLVTVEDLTAALRALPPGRGRPKVARALQLVDPRSGSVLESLCRVLLHEQGLPAPVTQLVVRHQGRWVGRVDFAWPGAMLVVEVDGFAFHSGRAEYRRDRRRVNALQAAGWVVLRFSWEDVVQDPGYVVASVAAGLGAARAAA